MANTSNNILCSAGLFALMVSIGAPAFAQAPQNDSAAPATNVVEDEEDVVIATGIRQSLRDAAATKRNSAGVVDAISATDIGKFPDTNLAESLQRVTGVSIDRSNNEGNQITVRGFGPRFNLVLLNGRSMPTSTALDGQDFNRSFNFQELAAGSVAAVEVNKTSRVDLPTGGIGSTVNIRTRKPFDRKGFVGAASAKAIVDTSSVEGSDITPQVSGFVSKTFMDDKIGLLAAASYSKRDSREERVSVFDYQRANPGLRALAQNFDLTSNTNPDGIFYLPRNIALSVADVERERINGQFVLQMAPTNNLEIDLDYHLSRFNEDRLANDSSFWYCFCPNRRAGAVDEFGVPTPIIGTGEDVDFFGTNRTLETHNDSIGINVDWQATDRLGFVFDAHRSISESQPDGQVAEVLTNFRSQPNVTGTLNFTDNDIPDLDLDFGDTPASEIYNRDNLIPDIGQQRGNLVKNTIDELKLTGTYDIKDGNFVESISLGGAYQDYEYDARSVATGNVSLAGIDVSQLDIEFVDRGDVASSFSGGAGLFPVRGIYNPNDAIALAFANGSFGEVIPRRNIVNEETLSAFAVADMEAQFMNRPFRAQAGLRYETTDVIGQTEQALISGIRFFSTSELNVERTDEQQLESIEGSYDYWLPSLNASLDVTDNFKLRTAYSKSLTRSVISLLVPETRINNIRPGDQDNGIFTAVQGNANLRPALSDNFDVSAEWYYAPDSYFSAGYFRKTVSAFVRSDSILTTLDDANGNPLRNPSVNPAPGCPDATNPACLGGANNPEILFTLAQRVNSDEEGTVDGFEVNLQHTFDFGFGVIANYTYTNGDIEYDITNFTGQEPAPLTGLSDSANLIGFYEKGPLELRVAYNWRDEFLTFLIGGNEPIFVDPYSQIDFSASYKINDKFSIFAEGLNITNEITRSHRRSQNQLQGASAFGPRYGFGIRGRF